jgi:hypothetical protein
MTEEQRVRWLELGNERCIKGSILVGSESYLSICATITAEAVAAERSRVAKGAGITERDAWAVCDKVFFHLNDGDNGAAIEFIRTLIAGATARERERCARWQPIETAPVGKDVLLYCPERGLMNEERIELGWADSGRGSHHAWATHWMPLPEPPNAAAHRAGEGE